MQVNLFAKTWAKDRFAFGGALLKNSHPKTKRCFRPKLALHVVIRSSRATGSHSLFLKNRAISYILERQAARHFVRLYSVANAGNHMHLLLQAPSQGRLSNFLRAITGRIAQLMGGAKGFWDARPFSRIVSWGRDFKRVAQYIGVNSNEMIGLAREDIRFMFEKIRAALKVGQIKMSPGLLAAGFG